MVKKIIGKSYLALILLLMYAPILLLVVFSFTNCTLVGTWNGFSLELYKQMFKNEEIMEALKNTIIIAVMMRVIIGIRMRLTRNVKKEENTRGGLW